MTMSTETRPVQPRVLIADDDPSVLQFLADHCAQLGFRVQTASNGLNAFAIAHRFSPDVLIIDVNMPEVDGMSLCEKLLAPGRKAIDLVVISGNPTPKRSNVARVTARSVCPRDLSCGTPCRPS